jgi:acyl-CoA thioester hydrolase
VDSSGHDRASAAGGPSRRRAPTRQDYPHFQNIGTRWMDADVYAHVNNVVYYSYFDTAVNRYLTDQAGLDPSTSPVVGLVVETGCSFKKSIRFPEAVDVGIRVTKIGTSSVVYDIGIFKEDDPAPAAFGHFVHVYVERATERPVPIPPAHREALEKLRGPD